MGAPKMSDTGLTLKQDRFVDAFIETGGNGKQAALIAGYSEASATPAARNNLDNDDVLAALDERRRAAEKRLGISPYYIARRLKDWADCENGMYSLTALVQLKKMFGYDAPARVDLEQNAHVAWVQNMIEEAKK